MHMAGYHNPRGINQVEWEMMHNWIQERDRGKIKIIKAEGQVCSLQKGNALPRSSCFLKVSDFFIDVAIV